ncbi:MAG: rod shape-determining protein RodA [Synergistaceae bacterium]|nr:rod shape-determining protein RodA [Synergistaceae bacterium]
MAEKSGSSWREIRSNIDLFMLFATIALFFLGIAAIYSASPNKAVNMSTFAVRQLVWGGTSAVIYAMVLKIGYQRFMDLAGPLFAAMVLVLLLILAVGYTSKGSQSWFDLGFLRIQPSEMGKVVLAIALAQICFKLPPTDIKGIAAAVGLAGVMIALILLQPDLGSSLVYSVMLFAVLVAAGASLKFLSGIFISILAMLPVAWLFLKPYQKMRLMVFMDPTIDPQGAGYNVIQSRIAVGSGGLFGKGFLHGTQGKLHFLPEPHTDFIFSVFSEEFGFIGCLIVVVLFTVLLLRMLNVAYYTKDTRGKLLITGIVAWMWFQITESIGMSMGLLPVTGLPLPLFSYGGSSLLAVAIALALVQSVVIVSKEGRF